MPVGDPISIAKALDDAILRTSAEQRSALAGAARAHAMEFDRVNVFDALFDRLDDRSAAA